MIQYGIHKLKFDTGYNNTKQLDYYSNLGVTTSNYSGTIKQNNESTYDWWLRSSKNRGQGFLGVHSDGTCYRYTSSGDTVWVSPAFRIG